MLRRLISAVFVLGLVLTLSGTAVSDAIKGELNPVDKVYPNNARFGDLIDARPQQPATKKPLTDVRELTAGWQMQPVPSTYFCDVQDYTSGNPYYVWSIPDAYGDDLFNMRFTVETGYECTLKVAHLLMYAYYQVGTPTMRVYLWDDDGFGFPGNKLDSVDIANPGLGLVGTNVMYWVNADFSAGNYVFADGDEYHYGWTQFDWAGSELYLVSDPADGPHVGEERASEYWGGLWGTMLNDWGIDISFFILSERCCYEIPFSDCGYQSYWQNITYIWAAPHPVWGDEAYAMRYDGSGGHDTLVFVDFQVYDRPTDPGAFGTDTVFMTVYPDDGAGLPNSSVKLAEVYFPPGGYNAFPTWTTATFNLVFTGDIHVAFSTSGHVDYEYCMSSDGSDGVMRSSSYWAGGPWVDMLTGWGLDCNFLIDPWICIDEFTLCQWNWCYTGPAYHWVLPDVYGDIAEAQKFTAVGEECRLEDVYFMMYWSRYDYALPKYSYNSYVKVWADAGGLPGTELASITVTPADYAAAGIVAPPDTNGPSVFAWLGVDFTPLAVDVAGDYWVGIESTAPTPDEGIHALSDAGGGGCLDGYAEYYGAWGLMYVDWGAPWPDWAMVAEAYHCCIPFGERDCWAGPPGEDWATYQHDYARTGASFNAVSDAWCDLTLNWSWEHPTQGVSFCGPIVAGDGVVCSFTNQYVKFDLYTGAVLYTLGPNPPKVGSAVRSTPTVAPIAGITDPVLFVSGGDQNSVMAYNYLTGALIWSRDITTVGTGGLFGQTRWGRFTVVNIGGTDVVYWGTDDGYVVAADAATGILYGGWGTNPVALNMSTYVSGATDGTSLFFATFAAGFEGDVYSIDAATGVINWALSAVGGLQGVNVWTHDNGYVGDEGFTGGVSFDAERGWLYANSRAQADHPTDGLFYIIEAATGALPFGTAILANRAYYQTPIIDRNHVYMPTLTRWVGPPAGDHMYAVNKNLGTIERLASTQAGDRFYVDGVLTCEPDGEPDYLFVFGEGEGGYLCMFNSMDFDEIFHRRIFHGAGYNPNIGMAGALTVDTFGEPHVLFADFWGELYDLTKQADRPRLEILDYTLQAPVEFGPAPSLIVTIEDVFTNTGCATLTFGAVSADEDSYGPNVPVFASISPVDPNLMNRAASIADMLAENSKMAYFMGRQDANESMVANTEIVSVRDVELSKETINRAAAAWPPYLNAIIQPAITDVLNPGDTMDLILDVIQAGFTRGPHVFYITLPTDDPDFFLNNPSLAPQIEVNLVGGCLRDTTHLNFGVGGANFEAVRNTGMIADVNDDNDNNPESIEIDGEIDAHWMGSYLFGVSQRRLALDMDYFNGTWDGWQADPNYCDTECKPALQTSVSMGEASSDGITYVPITGNAVCASGVDSVQNFDDGGWDWDNTGAPFDNDSSMGLAMDHTTYGALDVGAEAPLLNNLTLEIFEFTERNNDSVPGFKFMAWVDFDINGMVTGAGKDSMFIDLGYSAAWAAAVDKSTDPASKPATNAVWGFVKLPFGCGETGLKNVVTLDSDNSFYSDAEGADPYLDSAYIYASRPAGEYSMPNAVSPRDQSFHGTFVERDVAPGETFSFGMVIFGLPDVPDGWSPCPEVQQLADLANKWSGHGRGDVNNDGDINLADIIYLNAYVNDPGVKPGPVPFKHLGDVDGSGGDPNGADVTYLIDFYCSCGPCPVGAWIF